MALISRVPVSNGNQRPRIRVMPSLVPSKRLHRRSAEADQNVRIGELDLAADEGQADRGLLRRRRAVAGRPPRHHVGDVDLGAIEPDRLDHAVEQFAGAADERAAGNIFLMAGRLADEHHAAFRIAVGENQLRRGVAQRAAFEAFEELAQIVEVRRGPGGFAGRHDGGVGSG